MTCLKGGGATGCCLTVSQSLEPRERRGVGFTMVLQTSVPLVYALTFPRSAHELIHHSADRRKTC
jgi:hypothetical protein